MSNTCPHCGGELRKQVAISRAEKAKALSDFYSTEFTTKDVLNMKDPSEQLATICKAALELGLTSRKTARGDRVSSLLRHLHAFAENQKPYGPKSRRAGLHWVWMNHKYGSGAGLANNIERLVKEKRA